MVPHFFSEYDLNSQMQSIQFMMMAISGLLHVIFAGAVAKDAGILKKRGIPTYLVSNMTWAFATLVGGVFIAAIYWFMHHLNMKR